MAENQELRRNGEQGFRLKQEKALTRLGFERFGASSFFINKGFVVAVEKNGQARLSTDYYRRLEEGSRIVGIEQGDPEGILPDALSAITEIQGKFERTTQTVGGSGGAREPGKEDLQRIKKMISVQLTEQLIRAGFTEHIPVRRSGWRLAKTEIFRRSFSSSREELDVYALVKNGNITRIVRPIPWGSHLVTPTTRITDFSIGEDVYDHKVSILSFENDFMRFSLESEYGFPRDVQLLREVTDSELGLEAISVQQEASGFAIGGVNESSLIRNLKSINNISIEELERRMRPRADARAGFLGEDASLLDALSNDNDFVLAQGLTHQALAHPLKYTMYISENLQAENFTLNGIPFGIEDVRTKGFQESPFRDSTSSSVDATVTNLLTRASVTFSYLHPHMIERYGFYEGRGTTYRVEPSQIIKVFQLSGDNPEQHD